MNNTVLIIVGAITIIAGGFWYLQTKVELAEVSDVPASSDTLGEVPSLPPTPPNLDSMSEPANDNLSFTTTASGLQYAVLTDGGEGPRPTVADTVQVHYHGTLADGTVFDSSVERGQPIEFPLSNLIAGWQEGIPMMTVGSKYRFIIPPELAYGPAGAGHQLSGQTLTFDVELLGIQ